MSAGQGEPELSEHFVETACARLLADKSVRRRLPVWGRLHVDRQLPFLCVYRRPPEAEDPGTERLVVGEASYLLASGERRLHKGLLSLVRGIAIAMSKSFGAFLVIQVWAAQDDDDPVYRPAFRVFRPKSAAISVPADVLAAALGKISAKGLPARVEVVPSAKIRPPGLPELLASGEADRNGWHSIGIEVRPIYRDPATGEEFPRIRRAVHRGLSRALQRCIFEFTCNQTTHCPPHYQSLGRRSIVKAVWEVDEKLAEVSNGFDFLLLVTPPNAEEAWRTFERERYRREPVLTYRALPVDIPLAKRELFRIPIDRIEDPVLERLFRQQQAELDRKLTMLGDRAGKNFLYGSLQVFGGVDEPLLATAKEILEKLPQRTRDEAGKGSLDAEAFAARARDDIARYRADFPGLTSTVEVREDVTGLMVSRGNLLVGAESSIPVSRVEALLSHEVGTHVLTYVNGRAQPFRQLYVGLPGYEELQEGIAVLAEHLVGGMSRPRLRLLAARVLAVHRMIDGASFLEVFRELLLLHAFSARIAFGITMRVFRSGGFTKDAAYLRGLMKLLEYLRAGGSFEPLLVGKLATVHVPIVRELQWRKVLVPPPLRPHYLDDPKALERLERLRKGVSVLDLIESKKKK